MGSLSDLVSKTGDTPVTMVTAYDATMARLVDQSDVDSILVGDSVGVAMLGYERTERVTVDDMVHHAAAVSRTAETTPVVVDLPFGAYNTTSVDAVRNANRLRKEGAADAIKVEGGREVCDAVEAVTDAGIPVFGHLGEIPQVAATEQTDDLVEDARLLADAGVSGIVLKQVDPEIAGTITESVDVVTIGIGSGRRCDGQVLTIHDLLGLADLRPETATGVAGRFGEAILQHLDDYHHEVAEGRFPE